MSSSMRKVKILKDTPALLKQQTSKLQQKLSLLRSQVTQKKKQKLQMNQTSTSSSSFRNNNNNPSSTSKGEFSKTTFSMNQKQQNKQKQQQKQLTDSKQLVQKLRQQKLQGLQQKLRQKNIHSIQKLAQTKQQEIDSWKDIAVGWRIKLKKLVKALVGVVVVVGNNSISGDNINSNSGNSGSRMIQSSKSSRSTANQRINSAKVETNSINNNTNTNNNPPPPTDLDIQKIISQRNEVKIFIPINRQYEQQQDNNQQQVETYGNNYNNMKYQTKGLLTEEDQQQRLIDKLMKAFQPRKGVLKRESRIVGVNKKGNVNDNNKNNNNNNNKTMITWSPTVQQLQKQFQSKSHKTYPKQSIVKQALIQMHNHQTKSNNKLGGMDMLFTNSSINNNNNNNKNISNQTRYCWKCFKRIVNVYTEDKSIKNNTTNQRTLDNDTNKSFCSTQCLNLYKQQTQLFFNNKQQQQQQQQQENKSYKNYRQCQQKYDCKQLQFQQEENYQYQL